MATTRDERIGRLNRARLPDGVQVVKAVANVYLFRMRVVLNGETRELRDGLTVSELVGDLGLGRRRVAVELNRAVLPRDDYARRALSDGDEIEIVQFIGGG